MKKLLLTVGICVVAAFGSKAAIYSFDSVNSPTFVAPNGQVGGTWNLNALGYDKDAEEVVSADAFFTLWDATIFGGDNGSETAVVSLDGLVIGSANNFVAAILGGSVLVTIAQDGIVNWLVKETSGLSGFAITDATFTVVTGPKTPVTSVPDGGSVMALLGLSVMGLGYAGRRMRA